MSPRKPHQKQAIDIETEYVSVHGGHSGEFCMHAADTLEALITTYIQQKFKWVGITEHMPPTEDRFLYPDELAAGMTAETRLRQFSDYFEKSRYLKKKYQQDIELLIGFETETYEGSCTFIKSLIDSFQPDYIVGSVHHIHGISFDFSKSGYAQCTKAVGGIDVLYQTYFDLQLEMIETLKPPVVGHFDLIRIFDPDYRNRLAKPPIKEKILRNLDRIKAHDLILDLNVRALVKGANEPYISESILKEALDFNISVAPGDDSHSIDTVGRYVPEGIQLLKNYGFDLNWRKPRFK